MTVDKMKWAELEIQLLYHLCWAIFHEKGFSDSTKKYIHINCSKFNDKTLLFLFEPVFFKFSSRMLFLLKNESYDEMITEYHSFKDY